MNANSIVPLPKGYLGKAVVKVQLSIQKHISEILKEIKNKIFQPFFTTKPTGEGTGLGLSLSYDIITKGHGGELKVETSQSDGTKFIVKLPGA